jgi:hypothetical protein
MRSFCFLLFLLSGAGVRSGPGAVKGAPFSGAAERTLEGEDRGERIDQGGKDLVCKGTGSLHHGGQS